VILSIVKGEATEESGGEGGIVLPIGEREVRGR
jgi:hypothetical protein